MKRVFLYSTPYHLSQRRLVDGRCVEIRIGHKSSGFAARCWSFLKALVTAAVMPTAPVYVPRAGSKDIWFLYRLLGKRATLISDGISDCLETIRVGSIFGRTCAFRTPVDPRFHVTAIDHPRRPVEFQQASGIGVFTKRGRDYDYVGHFVSGQYPGEAYSVNPKSGAFREIYLPASTLIFELGAFPREHLRVVSCRVGAAHIPEKRLELLLSYEKFLRGLGFKIVGAEEEPGAHGSQEKQHVWNCRVH